MQNYVPQITNIFIFLSSDLIYQLISISYHSYIEYANSLRSLGFGLVGSRSRSQLQVLEKLQHSRVFFIYGPIWISPHTLVKYDNILDKL